jgi:death-on-curing family protein
METVYPTIKDIIEINKKVGAEGTLINKGNLEFTLDKAQSAKSFPKKASIILLGIVRGHPFVDGNKRTAFVSMDLFLKINGKKLEHGKGQEHLMERILYDIAQNNIKEESLERIIAELIK